MNHFAQVEYYTRTCTVHVGMVVHTTLQELQFMVRFSFETFDLLLKQAQEHQMYQVLFSLHLLHERL